MKKLFLTGILLLLSTLLFAQDSKTEQRRLAAFDVIRINGYFTVVLQPGSEEKAEIESQTLATGDINTQVKDGVLELSLAKKYKPRKAKDIRVVITYKSLGAIHASGASDIQLIGTLAGDQLHVRLRGASNLSGALDVNYLGLHSSGASDVEVSGRADVQEINLSGACDLKGATLKGSTVNVRLSGACDAYVYATNQLDARVLGAGDVRYKGNPHVVRGTLVAGSIMPLQD